MTLQPLHHILTTGEAALLSGVSQQTVIRWLDDGLLPGWKIPGSSHRRVHREVLKQFCHDHGIPFGHEKTPDVLKGMPYEST